MHSSADLFDLTGRAAIITGSTRGMGFAIAEQFVRRGARVAVSSRKADGCQRAVARLQALGGEAIGVPCNVSSKDQLQTLVDAALRAFGTIDILVCAAGINPHFGPLAEISDEAYDRILGTNVRSTLWLCNMVLPQMVAAGGGAVIIMASIAAFVGSRWVGAYGISKAAEVQLARSVAVEWGPRNIRVNCLAPGVIKTEFARALYADPAAEARLVKRYPLGRLGEPADVAGAAVFLASRAGAFITGQTLVIDGGATIAELE
ncbi:MAG: SDR family oxidoreductase [Candidatus Eremiobacteraeota bacterium]|nr:SDR family oxidoreductase [Candidatus Eremiobacteraeota bacterium]